jgi:hypothetical protein
MQKAQNRRLAKWVNEPSKKAAVRTASVVFRTSQSKFFISLSSLPSYAREEAEWGASGGCDIEIIARIADMCSQAAPGTMVLQLRQPKRNGGAFSAPRRNS